jgi:hypothetical protein
MREAFRKNKSMLAPATGGVHIAFLWSSPQELPSDDVERRMQKLLKRIHESLSPAPSL